MSSNKATFLTVVENVVTLKNKEFRISATENTNNGTYLVGIREYTRKETFTGYSKYNGVTLPVPTKDEALSLVNIFTQNLGMLTFPVEQMQQQPYAPQGQQPYAPQGQQQTYAPPQQAYTPAPPPYNAPQSYEPVPPVNTVPQQNPFLQNIAPTPYDNSDDGMPY